MYQTFSAGSPKQLMCKTINNVGREHLHKNMAATLQC